MSIKTQLEQIKNDVTDLRDADSHVCQHSEQQARIDEGTEPQDSEEAPCTCHDYDQIISRIDLLLLQFMD